MKLRNIRIIVKSTEENWGGWFKGRERKNKCIDIGLSVSKTEDGYDYIPKHKQPRGNGERRWR